MYVYANKRKGTFSCAFERTIRETQINNGFVLHILWFRMPGTDAGWSALLWVIVHRDGRLALSRI